MAEGRIARQVRVTGRVQGVYFRGWTQSEARRLGLGGWVRNDYDGSVAALIAGPPEAVEEMLRLMHRGPFGGGRGGTLSCRSASRAMRAR